MTKKYEMQMYKKIKITKFKTWEIKKKLKLKNIKKHPNLKNQELKNNN